MNYPQQSLSASLDSVFAEIKSYWPLFERCTFDDLFLSPAFRAKLRAGGIDSFQALIDTNASDLSQSCHASRKEIRQLKQCSVSLLEREVYPPEGFDVLLKQLRNLETPERYRLLAGDVSPRAANMLKRAYILTYRDLSCATAKHLSQIPYLGKKSLQSVVSAVERFLAETPKSDLSTLVEAQSINPCVCPARMKGEFIDLLRKAFTEAQHKASIPEEVCLFLREKSLSAILDCARKILTLREADIFEQRHISQARQSYVELGQKYSVSAGRIRELDLNCVAKIKGTFRRDPVATLEHTNAFYKALCVLTPAQLRSYAKYLLKVGDIDAEIISVIAFDAKIDLPRAYQAMKDSCRKKPRH